MKKDGIWVGHMTEAQAAQGGIWTIGNQPYDPDPDYPGKNDGSLLVKSWVANPDKYRNYKPKTRLDDNKWEYVHVFGGCLECKIVEKEKTLRFPLYPSDGGIDIAPENMRGWYLPILYSRARGITVCRNLPAYPLVGGWGVGYEFAIWDTEAQWDRLVAPTNFPDWRIRYIEVFSGSVELNNCAVLKVGSHAFCARGTIDKIHQIRKSRGVVIYIA